MIIQGLLFELTCSACPEQYDVFKGDEMVAYIRLRGNHLRVYYPNYGPEAELIYSVSIVDYPMQGAFSSDEQRMFHLNEIAEIINAKRCGEAQAGH